MFAGFITWRDGRAKLRQRAAPARACRGPQLPELLGRATRVPGTAVFLVSQSGFVPTALLRNLEHNHVCHERIVILNLEILRTPRQDRAARAWVEELMPNVHAVHARFGFMETPDVTEALRGAPPTRPAYRRRGLHVFPRLAPRARAAAARARRAQVAGLRLSAAAQRAGRGVLPHADEARRRARHGDRHLAARARGAATRYATRSIRASHIRRGIAMPLYIVQFEDKPNMGELREKLLKSHFEFLDRVKDRVLVPGSMREVPSDKPLGGLVDHRGQGRGRGAGHLQGRSVLDERHARQRPDQPLAEGVPGPQGPRLAARISAQRIASGLPGEPVAPLSLSGAKKNANS